MSTGGGIFNVMQHGLKMKGEFPGQNQLKPVEFGPVCVLWGAGVRAWFLNLLRILIKYILG